MKGLARHPSSRLALALALFAIGAEARGQSAVTATIAPRQADPVPVSERANGLSYETGELTRSFVQGGVKVYRLSAENTDLVGIFRSLGVRSLRIGGNSSDATTFVVGPRASTVGGRVYSEDLDRLFAFARAAGVEVILSVPLKVANPDNDALMAAYARENGGDVLAAIGIGNEPDLYARNNFRPAGYGYPAYKAEVDSIKQRILAIAPDVVFAGPNTAGSSSWVQSFAGNREAAILTRHNYPGGNGATVTNPASARDRLLLIDNQGLYDQFAPAVLNAGLTYRLEETNSYYGGGAANVSNAFAASLWGLDYLHWWASHHAQGINFHTGDTSGGYSAITADTGAYVVRPLGYGIKAFDLGGHGRPVPVTLGNPDKLNLTAYALLQPDRRLSVTIINKTHASAARDAVVTLGVLGWYSAGRVAYLEAPGQDVAALSGITLGGATIGPDGSWSGTTLPLKPPALGRFVVPVPAATAAVVELIP